jgi:predicted dienelactone hydrolase
LSIGKDYLLHTQSNRFFEEEYIMGKRLFVVLMMVTLVMAVLPMSVTAQEGEEPPYAKHGPYAVGTMDIVVEDAVRPLEVTVWYPALNPNNLPEEVTYYWASSPQRPIQGGHALLDAIPNTEGGPYPLAIFSHGLWSYRFTAVYLTEHLASYGFVVMALDHFGDTMGNVNNPEANDFHILRPRDISRIIDAAEELTAKDDVWQGVIDVGHVAVLGHSFGGYTTLAAAGARIHFGEFDELFCQDPEFVSRDFGMCALLPMQDHLTQVAGLDGTPDGLWPSFGDARVNAIVPLAPGSVVLFGQTGLQEVTVPALFMVGSMDALPPEYYANWAYEHVNSEQKTLITLEGAEHAVFMNGCDAVTWQAKEFCTDPVWDMDRAHKLINHFTTAFLLVELYGDEEAAAALAPEAVNYPGITYETTGY